MPDPFPPDKPSAIADDAEVYASPRQTLGRPEQGRETSPAEASEPAPDVYESPAPVYEPIWVPVVRPRVRNRTWLHALLFFITILTTTFVGIEHWLSFADDFGSGLFSQMTAGQLLGQYWYYGFWYSATILLILGAHELGHYFACRYYGIDASLPYFMPLPPPFPLTGTLGAFIRIRQPVTTKRELFDIGIAGPLAGFIFAVPALFLGIAMSHVVRVPADFSGLELGEPLLFKLASWTIWGHVADGYSLNLHPMAFAAWFGLLATALNLFPVGQLDGGHISYTVLGRRSTIVTLVMMGVAVALAAYSLSLVLWTVLLVVMLFAFGAKHPPVIDEDVPLDGTRLFLAVVALAMLILCFTPSPIRPLDLLR